MARFKMVGGERVPFSPADDAQAAIDEAAEPARIAADKLLAETPTHEEVVAILEADGSAEVKAALAAKRAAKARTP